MAFKRLVDGINTIPLGPTTFCEEVYIIEHLAHANELDINFEKKFEKNLINEHLDLRTSFPRDVRTSSKKKYVLS